MKQIRVLLVDDEEDLVITLAERLSMRGIDAKWASSWEAASKILAQHRFDVGVLDIKMPRISGFEIKRKMESIDPAMRFIFITGHGSEQDFMKGVAEAGASNYLLKPVDIELLLSKLKEIT